MMKKALLVAISLSAVYSGFAQRSMHGQQAVPVVAAKPTAVGDTRILTNIGTTDTVRTVYSHIGTGSGYVTGTNSYNDRSFAERYNFNGADSSMKVTGVIALFGGTVNPASTKNVTFKVWAPGASSMISATLYYNSFPATAFDSVVVPVTQLGIGPVKDTAKSHMFAVPTNYLSGTFFVGYSMNYNYTTLAGDTIGLASSLTGHRNTADYTMKYITNADGDTTAIDTVLNVQNATQWSDGKWYDNYTQNDSIANNLAIFPVVVIGAPTGISGLTRNQLTFYGSYPNPAYSTVNIMYALNAAADVTVEVMDMSGRMVTTVQEKASTPGKHTMQLNTSGIPAGDYIYIIRTSAGDGMASKLTILK